MECLGQAHPLHRAFSVMAADTHSPLDRDERHALLCWLQGMPSNVLILLPSDLFSKLVPYLEAKDPGLLEAVRSTCGATLERAPMDTAPSQITSPLEVDFYLLWQEQSLDLLYPLTPQYPVKDGQYYLDFAFPPLKVGIELDSYTYHSDRETFTRDRQRQREIEADGWRIIRFSGDEIRADVARCVRETVHLLSIRQFHQQQQTEEP